MNNPKEQFKAVVGFEGLYEVSNQGRVKSLKRKGCLQDRILQHHTNKRGYQQVVLAADGSSKATYIHVLMAAAFLGVQVERYVNCVDHLDNDPTNNTLENIKVVPHRFNSSRRKDTASKYQGVSRNNKGWNSRIYLDGQHTYLGYFEDEIDAASAYQEALLSHRVKNINFQAA